MSYHENPINPPASDAQPSGQAGGLLSGHAKYAQGVVEEQVGAALGSQPWKDSGAQHKAEGLDAMGSAAAKRDPTEKGFGKAEELAGKATGCEGMQKEGAASRKEE